MKNHSYNLHAPICGIFCFHSVAVARYAALIQAKSSTSQAQPSENERILICGLGASVGYERVERVFNTPRLKSQIRILSFSEGVSFACGKSPTHVYVWEQFSSPVLS